MINIQKIEKGFNNQLDDCDSFQRKFMINMAQFIQDDLKNDELIKSKPKKSCYSRYLCKSCKTEKDEL